MQPTSGSVPESTVAKPSRVDFHELARTHRVVPVWRELLADLITPVAAYARICGDEPGFLFESVEHGQRWGRWSFIGRRPLATLRARGMHVDITGDIGVQIPDDQGALAAVEAVLSALSAPAIDGLPPFHAGLVGFLGYDVVREVERLDSPPEDDRGFPDAVMYLIGELAAFDHFKQRVTLVANALIPDGATDDEIDAAYDDACARLEALAAAGARPLDEPLMDPPDPTEPPADAVSNCGSTSYRAAVEAAREHIFAGDVFQVVLSQRFELDLEADPFDVYRVLRQINPSPYMYFVRDEELTLVGSSPEPLVTLRDGIVTSRPIAGTRFRGATEEDDRRLGAELREHPKEVAEHVMLVDLARNDVGRVVQFGTCTVDEMMTLERYSHVMHLTSEVTGLLRDDATAVDVLRATMPAGTVSGAPKVRAMQIIDDLEPHKRGPYAGVVGYIDLAGTVDTAIAIRTMVVAPDGRAWVQAGAGIVADSVAEDEDLECHNKARALLAAVPAARRMTASR